MQVRGSDFLRNPKMRAQLASRQTKREDLPRMGSELQAPPEGGPTLTPPPQGQPPMMPTPPQGMAMPPPSMPQQRPLMNFSGGGNPFAAQAAQLGFSDFQGGTSPNYAARSTIMNRSMPPPGYRPVDQRIGRGNLQMMQAQALRGNNG